MSVRRLIPLIVALALFTPASAGASATALIRDCLQNGKITGHYSPQDYNQALAHLPTDVSEYSDCLDVIRRARLSAAGGKGNGGGGGGGRATINPRLDPLAHAAPGERAAVLHARSSGSAPVDVGGQLVRPGVVAVRSSSIFNALPTPLLVVIAALLSIAAAVAGRRMRDLVRARRGGA
jgi:hypothetical protein